MIKSIHLKTLFQTCTGRLIAKSAIFFLIAGLYSTFFQFADAAGPETTFVLEGLTFLCPDCRQRDDGYCEIPEAGETLLINCHEAPIRLLKEVLRNGYDGHFPRTSELATFLLKTEDTAAARIAIQLLLQTQEGKGLFIQRGPQLLTRWSTMLREMIEADEIPQEFLQALWRLPRIDAFDPGLQAAILSKEHDLALEDVLGGLTVNIPERDLANITSLAALLKSSRNDLAISLENIASRLRICSAADLSVQFPSDCTAGELKKLSAPEMLYLERVLLQRALRESGKNNPDLKTTIRKLEQMDYRAIHTPETHAVLVEALKTAIRKPSLEILETVAAPSSRRLLLFFAKNDHEIRKVLKELSNTLLSIPEVSKRDDLELGLELLGAHTASRSMWTYVLIGATSLLGFLLLLMSGRKYSCYRQNRKLQAESAEKLSIDRAELRRLCAFFNLPPTAREPDLTREYRNRAKELHPDTGSGEGFSELTQKYNRAKELLTRREV